MSVNNRVGREIEAFKLEHETTTEITLDEIKYDHIKTSTALSWSCSIPRWDNLPSGHQRNPLLGIILWYMYWGQKHSSE